MKTLPIEMTENGIHYTLHGDYYFPNLTLPETGKSQLATMDGCDWIISGSIAPGCIPV